MGDEKKTEDLDDVDGGNFGPFPGSESAEEPLRDVEGGAGDDSTATATGSRLKE